MAVALTAASFAGTATVAFADQITTVSSTDSTQTVTVRRLSNRERRRQLALTVQGSVETTQGIAAIDGRGTTGQPSVYNEDNLTQTPGEFYAAY